MLNLAVIQGLKTMLDSRLSTRERTTVEACWEEYIWGDWEEDSPLAGVRHAAWHYSSRLAREREEDMAKPADSKAPHELQKELEAIIADARSFRAKLDQVSRDCLTLIENSALKAGTGASILHSSQFKDMEWTDDRCTLEFADLHGWFQIRRGYYQEDGSLVEIEPWWGKEGVRPFEVETLAKGLELIVKDVESMKQAKNGRRAKTFNHPQEG